MRGGQVWLLTSAGAAAGLSAVPRFVYIRSPPVSPALAPAYRGPYQVRVPGATYFVIDAGGKPSAVSVDNIKPHLGSSPLSAAPPPRRGTGLALKNPPKKTHPKKPA